jgi:uncharacterized protein (DUF2267 family)
MKYYIYVTMQRGTKMDYKELVGKVQQYSGFSAKESQDALECTVETIAVHLDEKERLHFANQLPEKLQDMALSVYASEENIRKDIIEQIMEFNQVSKERARKQLQSAWKAIKEIMSSKESAATKTHLPHKIEAMMT